MARKKQTNPVEAPPDQPAEVAGTPSAPVREDRPANGGEKPKPLVSFRLSSDRTTSIAPAA